eukprot:1159523-Pelagomonas_calceolata.AAC.1
MPVNSASLNERAKQGDCGQGGSTIDAQTACPLVLMHFPRVAALLPNKNIRSIDWLDNATPQFPVYQACPAPIRQILDRQV